MGEEPIRSGPKASFYVVLLLVVMGLAAYGLRDIIFPKPQGPQKKQTQTAAAPISPDQLQKAGDTPAPTGDAKGDSEAPDSNIPTTVKEYNFKASEKLPPVSGISNYQPLSDRTVKSGAERVGRLGADHPPEQRQGSRRSVENTRRAGFQGRAGSD
jgi:hypothetical protein